MPATVAGTGVVVVVVDVAAGEVVVVVEFDEGPVVVVEFDAVVDPHAPQMTAAIISATDLFGRRPRILTSPPC